MMKKKIVITGVAGLVGLNLLTELNLSKYDVVALDRNAHNIALAKKIFPKARFLVADVTKKGKWQEEFKDAHCIIQLQAQISSPEKKPYYKNNVDAVNLVLETCKKYKIKNLIFTSSSVVISVAKDNYTVTKTIGENLVAKSGVPYTSLRPPLMYGCFDIKHLGFLTSLLEKSPVFPVPGSGKYMRQPLFVLDLCKIIVKLIEKKPYNKTFNVIGKERINFIDLMKTIAREKKLKRIFVNIPIPIFIMMLKTHGLITGKKPFVKDQLLALTAGDDFPVDDWEKRFGVKYTPFSQALKKTYSSKYYKYRLDMKPFE